MIFILDLSTLTILVFGSVNVILTSYLIYIHTDQRNQRASVSDELASTRNTRTIEDTTDLEIRTSYDIMRSEREEMLDQRTQRLKEEIAMERDAKRSNTSVALELHPDVHNLPHDGVFFNFDKEEIAE